MEIKFRPPHHIRSCLGQQHTIVTVFTNVVGTVSYSIKSVDVVIGTYFGIYIHKLKVVRYFVVDILVLCVQTRYTFKHKKYTLSRSLLSILRNYNNMYIVINVYCCI